MQYTSYNDPSATAGGFLLGTAQLRAESFR